MQSDIATAQAAVSADAQPVTFVREGAAGVQIVLLAIVTAALFAIGLLGFVISISLDLGVIGRTGITVVPIVGGVACAARLLSLGRMTRSVTVAADGVTIEQASGTAHYAWSQIGSVKYEKDNMYGSGISLLDNAGKKLAVISLAISRHDELARLLQEGVAAHNADVAEVVQKKVLFRQGVLIALFGVVAMLVGGGLIYGAFETQRADALFASAAVDGEAVVTDLIVAPNGRTKRVYFAVEGDNGVTADHNVEADETYWHSLSVGDLIAVRFVPAEPSIAQMAQGQVIDDGDPMDSPLANFGLGGVAILFGIVVLGLGIACLMGYDIDKMFNASK